MASLAAVNAEFCFNLFREMDNNQGNGNVFFSSLSIFTALAVVRLGARGDGAAQMDKVLHTNSMSGHGNSSNTQPGLQFQLKRILSDINTFHKEYELSIASGLFAEKMFDFHEEYIRCAEKLYNAKVERVDFTNAVEDARYKINNWVKNETHGKIKNIISEGSISSSVVMVLVNAVYFKGKWESAFLKSDTRHCRFKSPKIENQLSFENLMKWTSPQKMNHRYVKVFLPQFKIEKKYEIKRYLQALGLRDIFDETRADFSGIASGGRLSLSKLMHESYIEVNEDGTEAAAVSENTIVEKQLPESTLFKADHPFLFVIRKNDIILFSGKVSCP
ncbi:serpin B7 isoform X3 [Pipistrellus kuhlii]|uniref:serpin B7 isoform X3 n=1 Tax=Pipistrellus kuhlii TaxID=59472 RepID=UPI00174F3AA9|nr:serpin B7 isoform X3 [Pipistrellus kuhlii]